MSKHLVLTIHPPIPECPQQSGWGFARDDWFEDRATERKLSKKKRLTESELAAEVFSAVFHEAECEVRGMRIERTWPAHPAVERYVTQNHEFGRQAMILERFATLPHYDEAIA